MHTSWANNNHHFLYHLHRHHLGECIISFIYHWSFFWFYFERYQIPDYLSEQCIYFPMIKPWHFAWYIYRMRQILDYMLLDMASIDLLQRAWYRNMGTLLFIQMKISHFLNFGCSPTAMYSFGRMWGFLCFDDIRAESGQSRLYQVTYNPIFASRDRYIRSNEMI